MTWLTWRQYRVQAAVAALVLAVFATVLLVTGFRMAAQWHTLLASCTASGDAHCIVSAALVAASAPISSAPSPPMMTMPSWAGRAVQRAVSISGAARVSVFCQENQVPNAPWYI